MEIVILDYINISCKKLCSVGCATKEFFRTCNVLPFSCTHLALWRGKEEELKLWLTI
jgi:hypothetical protein